MSWLLLLACTENNLVVEEQPTPAGDDTAPVDLPGALEASPERVHLGELCPEQTASQTITLTSTGPGQVEVFSATAESWLVEAPDLPAQLPVTQSVELTVTGTAGEDTLVVENDGAKPLLEIPLAATLNPAPALTIQGPNDDTVLDIGQDVSLLATVSDGADSAGRLVEWSSDVDGVLGTATTGSDGSSELVWLASARSPGPHALTARVVDDCGQEDSVELGLCQQAGYDAESLDLSGWHFEGSARYDSSNGWVELTNTGGNLVGAAWQTGAVTRGNNVTLSFKFYMGDGSGADGFAVTALDTDRMTGWLGGAGGCLGYGGASGCPNAAPGLPGWTLEVDGWYNSGHGDPTEADHLAFSFDGDFESPEVWAALPEMENTGWHEMEVTVNAPRVTVSIDGVVYIDQDIPGTYDFPAYVGFTASTGGSTNNHLIDALTVTEYICEGDG